MGGSRYDIILDIILSSADSSWKTSQQLISGLRCKAGTSENKVNMFFTWPHLVFLLLIPTQHSLNLGKCDTKWWSQHSVVTSVTGYGLDYWGLNPDRRERSITFTKQRLALGPTRPGHEANHSLPSSSEIRTEWTCNSTSPVCLHGRYRDNFNYVAENDYFTYTVKSICVEWQYNSWIMNQRDLKVVTA